MAVRAVRGGLGGMLDFTPIFLYPFYLYREHTLVATASCDPSRLVRGTSPLQTPCAAGAQGQPHTPAGENTSPAPHRKAFPMWIKIRTDPEEKRRWQALAENKGVSLSALVRALLDGQRLRRRREAPKVDPDLLRELARIGNNLNQLAHAANRRRPVETVALLVRLIEIDRELSALRQAHERPADAD